MHLSFCETEFEAAPQKETHEFQAETSRLLDIIINSLYSQKEIFLREAISNANDALDKIRFLGLEDAELLKDETDLKVSIEVQKDKNMLVLTDTGVGMTIQDLKNNLGTIARSGTTQFLEAITSKAGNLNLIGQFGVGFYSYFLVANHVKVITKSPYDSKQYIWESEAGSTYSIMEDTEGPFLTRGSRIELILKKDAKEFLEIKKIKELTKKYSEFIEFPIYLYTSKEVSKEVEVEKEVTETDDAEKNADDLDIKDDTEETKEKKTIVETVWEWEQVNNEKAIWKKSADSVSNEDYINFYKATSKDYTDPLSWIHFKAEGEISFTSLLYIPKKLPSSMKNPGKDVKESNLKLYVRKVLISDKFDDLLPKYLSFVSGVIDSDDLPLNVSRETLQQYRSVKLISKKLTKKVLDQLIKFSQNKLKSDEDKDMSEMTEEEKDEEMKKRDERKAKNEEDYLLFHGEFSKFLKHGLIEDVKNRDKLASLIRFPSTNGDKLALTSFDDYISRMPEDQKVIYFIAGEDKNNLKSDPTVRSLVKKGYEVFIMNEAIDEYCVMNLKHYKDLNITNVTSASFNVPQDDNEESQLNRLSLFYKPLTDFLTKILSDSVESVVLSLHTDNNVMVIKAGANSYTANMQNLTINQAMGRKKEAEDMLNRMKNQLHLNPNHVMTKELLDRVKRVSGEVDSETHEMAKIMFEIASIQAGFRLKKPLSFVKNVQNLLGDSMGLERGNTTVDLEDEMADFEKLKAAKQEAEKAEKDRLFKLDQEEQKRKAQEEEEKANAEQETEIKVEDVETSGEFNADAEL